MLLKKLLLAASITTGLVLCSSALTFADGVTVKIGNETLETDQPPVIVEGRTLVPFRAIYEGLGAEVEWNDATREATGKRGETTVTMTIDKPEMQVNGETIALDVPAKIINDRTMVPVRAVSDGLDETVDWDPITKTVKITTSYVALNTNEVANALIHPGWLDEANLYYKTGLDECKDPTSVYARSFQFDENGNRIWINDENTSTVSLISGIDDVVEGQEAKDIAIAQGALDADKLEQKIKDTFGSAKWVAIKSNIAGVNDFTGQYIYSWLYSDADIDRRKDDGEIDFYEAGESYLLLYPIVYNNKLYNIAYSHNAEDNGWINGTDVFCLPEDYDNLLFWQAGTTETTFKDAAALMADILASSTKEKMEHPGPADRPRAAIFLPLKPNTNPSY